MKIITNNIPRPILFGYELSESEASEFDYLDSLTDHSFIRYRGEVYDLDEFGVWDNPASPTRDDWHGFRSDSFFSGLVVRYTQDFEAVVVGLALS